MSRFPISSGADWDVQAAEYARMMKDGPMMTPIRAMLERMDDALPFSSATGIADVGCGPGPAIKELLDVYESKISPSAKLVASDFSEGMVEQVRKLQAKQSGNPIWERLETHVWDVQDLGQVADDSFSHVMGSLVFFIPKQPRQALSEVNRVLGKGGLIALTSWHIVTWMELMEAAARAARPDLGASRKPFEMPTAWRTIDAVKKELEATGFKNVHAEYTETFLTADNPRDLIRWFTKGKNPLLAHLVAGFGEEDLEKLGDEFERLVNEQCPVGPKKLKGVAIVATARK